MPSNVEKNAPERNRLNPYATLRHVLNMIKDANEQGPTVKYINCLDSSGKVRMSRKQTGYYERRALRELRGQSLG